MVFGPQGTPCMHGFILIGAAGHPQGQQTPDKGSSRHQTRQDGQGRVKKFLQGSTGGNQTGRGATNRLLQNKIATTNQKLLPYCKTVRTESQQTAR